jgi:hypothetical protein
MFLRLPGARSPFGVCGKKSTYLVFPPFRTICFFILTFSCKFIRYFINGTKSQLLVYGNGSLSKKLIHSLVQDEGTIVGHEQLKSYITNYYKGLFGNSDEGTFTMEESRIQDIP